MHSYDIYFNVRLLRVIAEEPPRNEIVPLFQSIRKWTSKNYRENGFGNLWLGNIVLGAGFEVDGNSENCLRCRGALSREPELYDDEEGASYISFASETAWDPVNAMWEKVLACHAPNCKYLFRSEECGMGYYATNDREGRFFPEDFLVDCCIANPALAPDGIDEMERAAYEDDVLDFLQKFLETDSTDTDALAEKFNKMSDDEAFGEDNFIHIHRYQYDGGIL